MQQLNPELAEWGSNVKTNAILADICDMLALINSNLIAMASRKPAKKPKPYPRPGAKGKDGSRHYGSGALPANELHEWIERKRAELCRK